MLKDWPIERTTEDKAEPKESLFKWMNYHVLSTHPMAKPYSQMGTNDVENLSTPDIHVTKLVHSNSLSVLKGYINGVPSV